MAVFPSLEPSSREWEFPVFPTLEFESKTWGSTSFEFGDSPGPMLLRLIYKLIEEALYESIRAHYLPHGMLKPFTLPATVWAGYTDEQIQAIAPLSTLWLYVDSPSESRPSDAPGFVSSTVSLISVPSQSSSES